MLAPIFLVGCPRSGTTLLQQMLDAHPDIAIAPETHFIRSFFLSDQYGDLNDDYNYKQLVKSIVDIPEFTEMELDSEEFVADSQTLERSYKSLFWLLLEQFRQRRRVRIVGEKTPNHLLYMQTLQEFFPKACFIHIIRDPRAVVSSWKKVPWTTGSVEGDARVWRRYMATARKSPPANGAIFSLHYESLVTEPEECLKSICNFLGIHFDRAMLRYYIKDSKGVNISREPWKRNAVKPVSEDALMKWQQELTLDEIATVELITRDELVSLGYKLYAPNWKTLQVAARIKTKRALDLAKQYVKKHM